MARCKHATNLTVLELMYERLEWQIRDAELHDDPRFPGDLDAAFVTCEDCGKTVKMFMKTTPRWARNAYYAATNGFSEMRQKYKRK